jgi:hypothetical protein
VTRQLAGIIPNGFVFHPARPGSSPEISVVVPFGSATDASAGMGVLFAEASLNSCAAFMRR